MNEIDLKKHIDFSEYKCEKCRISFYFPREIEFRKKVNKGYTYDLILNKKNVEHITLYCPACAKYTCKFKDILLIT